MQSRMRQSQVERLKLLGHQNPEMGRFLEVSPKTVDADWTVEDIMREI